MPEDPCHPCHQTQKDQPPPGHHKWNASEGQIELHTCKKNKMIGLRATGKFYDLRMRHLLEQLRISTLIRMQLKCSEDMLDQK